MKNLVEIIQEKYPTLYSLVAKAKLGDTLKNSEAITILVPNEAAFKKIDPATLEQIGNDPDKLKAILTLHVIPGKITSDQIIDLTSAKTLGGTISIQERNGSVVLNNTAHVVKADIEGCNGIIHEIDTVILPS